MGVADLGVHPLIAEIHRYPNVLVPENPGDLLGVLVEHWSYRNHHSLYRRQPDRECPAVMLDQDTEKPLQRSEQRPMHHVGPVQTAVISGIGHIETLGQIEVKLDRGHLPLPSQGILDFQVDLRSVEGPPALVELIIEGFPVDGLFQAVRCLIPALALAHALLLGLGSQVGLDVLEPKGLPDVEGKPQGGVDLLLNLLGGADDVSIILGKAPHPKQPVEHTGTLVAVHGPQFGPAQRQFPIRTKGGFVDHDMEGAVHRLEVEIDIIDGKGGVHVFFEEIQMPRGLPQPVLSDVGGVDEVIAVLEVLPLPIILDQMADQGPLGVPVDQARPGLFVSRIQVQVLP
ncbi:hypothetical protein ES708_07471 [subsurface metagenome]